MLTTILTLTLLSGSPESLKLHPVLSGAMPKVGFYVPQRLELSDKQPDTFKNVPTGAALFGTWEFGGKNYPTVEVDKDGKPVSIEMDLSGKGDFSGALVTPWKGRPTDPKQPDGLQLFMTDVMAPAPIGNGQPVQVTFYRFDPRDTQRAQLKNTLLFYGNYALDGTATLGGKEYHVMLVDMMSKGDFGNSQPSKIPNMANYSLLIDRDGDGRFRGPSESFDATKPFNIGGTTYELKNLGGDGLKAKIVKSDRVVAEIPVPPSLAPGTKIVAFTAVDRSGKTVHFPADFKGKVVMLDFWATWCGPCMGEVPNVVSTYNKLHGQGFEILGVSLDNAQTISKIDPVTKQAGMTWDQIADGKYWDAAIAKLYGVQAIPAAYLVDGDNGVIFGQGDAIRGENLEPAVKKALASKQRATK